MYNIFDGDILSNKYISLLSDYLLSNENNLFIKDREWKSNFVGYFSIYIDGKLEEFFSFPKEYEIRGELQNNYKDIINVLNLYEKSVKGISHKSSIYISGELLFLSNIIDYYKKYGLHFEKRKNTSKGAPYNINFGKTTNKIVPVYYNGNLIYNQFINTTKTNENTFLADCIVDSILYACEKYEFLFNEFKITQSYNRHLFNNKKQIILKLKDILKNTFKEHEKFLIQNLIDFYEKKKLNNINAGKYCKTNFEIVWESMVSKCLDDYEKVEFTFTDKKSKFIPDHLNINQKIIIDSKYYSFNDYKQNYDYKQYSYVNLIVHDYLQENLDNTNFKYKDFLVELGQWRNILIKPIKNIEEEYIFFETTINDNITISTLYIEMNSIMEYYIGKTKINPIKNKVTEINLIDKCSI